MRILKFFGAFLLTAILLLGFVIGWNWNSFSVFLENRGAFMEGNEWISKTTSLRGLSEFMGENPEYTSLSSIVIGSPDSTIHFMEDTPRVMGTTTNFFILCAYAIEFDTGRLNPDTLISWDDVNRYQLTNIEETIHNEVTTAAIDRGLLQDGHIRLDDTIGLLVEFNDFTLADYLWWQLDLSTWDELKNELGLVQTQMPLPYSGLYLAISPGVTGMDSDEIITRWRNSDEPEWRNHVQTISEEYIEVEPTRTKIDQYLSKNRLGITFIEERNSMILFPKSTSRELSHLLVNLVQDRLINETVSVQIKEWLRWPIRNQQNIRTDFDDYGAMYDNRMGILNGINFGTSTYTGNTTVQAMFFDRLPVGFWFHASGSHMHQDFIQRLIYDPAMIEQVKKVTEQKQLNESP